MRQHSKNAGNIYGTEFGWLYEISKAPKLMKFSNIKLNHTDFTLSPFRCAKGVAVAGSFSAAGSVGITVAWKGQQIASKVSCLL